MNNASSLPRSVLVTGAAGFIGSHLVDALALLGRKVIAVDCLTGDYDPVVKLQNIRGFRSQFPDRFLELDLRDADALEQVFQEHQPGTVFHLAGKCNVRESVHSPLAYRDANLGSTQALLECCSRHPVQRLIFASTSSVYHRDGDGEPVSPYAQSKLQAERAIERWAFEHPSTSCLALRLFSVYGPRLRPDLVFSEFVRKLLVGETMEIFGDGKQVRDFTHVSDVIAALLRCLERELPTGTDNFTAIDIGRGQPETLDHALGLISRRIGLTATYRFVERNPFEALSLHADGRTAERVLGFRPKVDLSEGLESFLQWRLG